MKVECMIQVNVNLNHLSLPQQLSKGSQPLSSTHTTASLFKHLTPSHIKFFHCSGTQRRRAENKNCIILSLTIIYYQQNKNKKEKKEKRYTLMTVDNLSTDNLLVWEEDWAIATMNRQGQRSGEGQQDDPEQGQGGSSAGQWTGVAPMLVFQAARAAGCLGCEQEGVGWSRQHSGCDQLKSEQ